jgi:hypothetical protein
MTRALDPLPDLSGAECGPSRPSGQAVRAKSALRTSAQEKSDGDVQSS